MSDELAARDALITLVNSLIAEYEAPALTLQETQNKAACPPMYAEVTVTRRNGGAPRRVGAASELTAYRAVTRAVARSENDALRIRDAVDALRDLMLTVDGVSTPVDYETSNPVAPDDDWFSGMTTWTFTV